ncbi:hypothetical protein [Crenobacter caeni]|nr:hypothetical protein [Crenobacter caeni]
MPVKFLSARLKQNPEGNAMWILLAEAALALLLAAFIVWWTWPRG